MNAIVVIIRLHENTISISIWEQKDISETHKIKNSSLKVKTRNLRQNCEFFTSKILQNPPKSANLRESRKISLQNPPKSSEILLLRLFLVKKTQLFQKKVRKFTKYTFFPHSPQNIQKVYKSPHNIHFSPHSPQNIHFISKDDMNQYSDFESQSQITCEYCSKKFSRIDNYNRHIANRCKVKIKKDEEEKYMMESLKKDKERMIEQHEKERNEYRKQIEKLLDKVGTTITPIVEILKLQCST